jgi:type I restriction enzyme S subunit
MSWEEEDLGELCEVTSSKRIFLSEYAESGIPFYRGKEVIQKLKYEEIKQPYFISKNRFEEIKVKFGSPKKGDILLTGVGTIGYPYLVKESDGDFYFKDGNLIWIKENESDIDPRYLFYYFFSSYFRSIVRNISIGSSQKALTISSVKSLKIPKPPLPTQKRIADILSAYDDLIENNLKRIKLLEQAAQNIYKEWFVHLRFPGHENTPINEETGLPVGWEIKRSDEVFKINIGKTPPRKEPEWFSLEKGYKWVSISDMNKSSVFIQKTKERITDTGVSRFNVKVVPKGTVLLSFKLTIGSVVIATEDMVTNEAIAHFNIDKNTSLSTEYTYCHLSCFPYKTLGSTSSIGQALNSKIVKSIPVLLPQSDLVNLFTKTVNPIFTQLENLITQNQKLKAARDILLPRLMNRTIEV